MKHMFSDVRPFARDPLSFLLAKSQSSAESLVPLALGPNRVLLVNDAELLKPILEAPEEFVDQGRLARKLESATGRRSRAVDREAHDVHRASLHEAITRAAMERLAPELLGEIRRAVFQLMRQSSFDAHIFSAGLALKLICTVLFGYHVLDEADEQALVESAGWIEDDFSKERFRGVPAMPWTKHKIRHKHLIAREVMRTILNRISHSAAESSVFKLLIQAGLSKEYAMEDAIKILLDCRCVTGRAIACAMYYLASNGYIKTIIAREADACLSFDGDIDHYKLCYATISAAFGSEIFRLLPRSVLYSMEARFVRAFGDSCIRPGDLLLVSPWVMHRSVRYWKDPELLDLSRDFESKAYLPFGVGPRASVDGGLALLGLQLTILDISAAFELELAEAAPSLAATAFDPPPIKLRLRIREEEKLYGRSAG